MYGLIAYYLKMRRKRLKVREGSIVVPQNIKTNDKDMKEFIGKECRVIIVSEDEIRIVTNINGCRKGYWWPKDYVKIKKY
jgi:hypothetical protein